MNLGDSIWGCVLAALVALLIYPPSHTVFVYYTKTYPYVMGFVKVSILATMGELLAIRVANRAWECPVGLLYRMIIWGLFGVSFVLVFEIFSSGVGSAVIKGLLPSGKGISSSIMYAFLVSAIMNVSFAPTMMTLHRMTDTYIDLMQGDLRNWKKVNIKIVVAKIDWQGLVSFVVFRTIPIFWIPAHTVTFLLPAEYRVLMAAMLSIALGGILTYSKRNTERKNTATIHSARCR